MSRLLTSALLVASCYSTSGRNAGVESKKLPKKVGSGVGNQPSKTHNTRATADRENELNILISTLEPNKTSQSENLDLTSFRNKNNKWLDDWDRI